MNSLSALLSFSLAIGITSCEERIASDEGSSAINDPVATAHDAPSEEDLRELLKDVKSIADAREALGPEMFTETVDGEVSLIWVWGSGTEALKPGDVVAVSLYFVDGRFDGWIPNVHLKTIQGVPDGNPAKEN